jgi:hypothetical protein
MFNYCTDWLSGRQAWLSAQFYPDYTPSYTIGDVNDDGKVDVSDVTEIQKYIASMTELTDNQLLAADVNADGKIDITDATQIQKYLAGIETTLG